MDCHLILCDMYANQHVDFFFGERAKGWHRGFAMEIEFLMALGKLNVDRWLNF